MQGRPNSVYTTPSLVSDQLVKADTGATQAETDEFNDYYTLVKQYCFDMSKVIETETQRTFVPYAAEKEVFFADVVQSGGFWWRQRHLGGYYVLELEDDLLAVNSLTYMSTTLTSSQYRLVDEGGSANGYPYIAIQFNTSNLPGYTTGFDDSIVIDGEWGTQDNSSDAYSTIGVTAEALDASETTIDVADGTLYNVYDYIRIENELIFVTAINTESTPNVLTVTRGVNGFAAAAHDGGATITRWNVPSDVRLLATRMVAYYYNKRSDKGERVQVVDNVLVIAQFSKEIAAIATRRQRNRYGVA